MIIDVGEEEYDDLDALGAEAMAEVGLDVSSLLATAKGLATTAGPGLAAGLAKGIRRRMAPPAPHPASPGASAPPPTVRTTPTVQSGSWSAWAALGGLLAAVLGIVIGIPLLVAGGVAAGIVGVAGVVLGSNGHVGLAPFSASARDDWDAFDALGVDEYDDPLTDEYDLIEGVDEYGHNVIVAGFSRMEADYA